MSSHISIAPAPGRVRVSFAGEVVVETQSALELREGAYPPVLYVPRADAKMAFFEPSTRRSRCPYKGEANYFSLSANGQRASDAVWSYETPIPGMEPIAGHLAFYPQHVTVERLPPA